MVDLQTIGRQLAALRKEVIRLEIENEQLRELIEDLICAPGMFGYFTGIHPMNDGS